jgi:hypothetical protein
LKEKLAKSAPPTKPTAPLTKLSTSSNPSNIKPPTPSSPTLKKPNSFSSKSNVKYTPVNHSNEALTKSPLYIKFNQIQIEKVETEIFNTPTPRQDDKTQREIINIINLELNTSSSRPNKILIIFPVPKLLPETVFIASESLSHTPPVDLLLIKKKSLRLSKHKINTKNKSAFTFEKPTFTNPPEYSSIEKPKR